MKYTVRFSEKQSGWVDVNTFDSLEDAKAEYLNQLEEDTKENTTNLRTEIVDNDGNVILFNEGNDY